MLRMASRFNKKYIESQRVDLRLSNGWSLPYGDSSFDKVYSVHTLYFWDKPSEYIQEIARVLRPRGRFVLGFRPGDDPTTGNFPASIYRFYTVDELGDLLAAGGFTKINMERGRTATGTMVFTICEAPQQTKAIAAADRGLPCAQTH
jgi:ubiquinone/menaquinone biosynthesis C-methylase UbiE